jgi:hypothetical protein
MGVRTGGGWGIGRGVGAAVGLLLLAGVAGCGASGASPTATTAQPDAAAVLREFVQCARDNGMPNLPDLRLDENGQIEVPAGLPEAPPSVERACRAIFERLPASARGDAEGGGDTARPPTDIQGLMRFAACMRQHGVPDWPDPKPDGTFPFIGTALEREGKSPRVLAASRACQQLNPDPNGNIHGS